ncbi:MAG: hypothetical protein F6K17_03475 [Okeania sp. SIO3C4]|nr:hypothetical protein [Okeania sp. SIO3B3]NER01755.1 hypothetical protein [Okeania sp. SIO3C4]
MNTYTLESGRQKAGGRRQKAERKKSRTYARILNQARANAIRPYIWYC